MLNFLIEASVADCVGEKKVHRSYTYANGDCSGALDD